MDAARHDRGKVLFAEALRLPREDRSAFLAHACDGDSGLRRELTQLLRHHEEADGFLTGRAIAAQGSELTLEGLELRGYRLERVLGRGGMGVVYLAEQESPKRQVALKFLRRDTLDHELLARFRREAEILGRLNHPGIAHVLEAGLAKTIHGPLPWIALEYVRGVTIRDWVVSRTPNLRDLVRLFASLCEAVDHAHKKGVVHRDLKPSNVLVDQRNQVRVLDFGVARLVDETKSEGNSIPRTRTGQIVGTLAYASPEQVSGRRTTIDARCDVYALGVMLFELLADELPYPIDEDQVLEAVQTITGEEPTRLRRRRPDAPGDLEIILRKALEKTPRRRYADAGELRADLERFLADRPVVARAPSTLYQAEKLLRRHPALVGSTVVVLLALVVSVVVLSLGQRRVEAQLTETSATLDFFARELFRLAPTLGFGEEERGSLEELEKRIQRQLEFDPENRLLCASRARALFELATLDLVSEDPERSFARTDAAKSLLDELLDANPDDLDAWTQLSQVYAKLGEARRDLGDEKGKLEWFQRALELDERLVSENPGNLELVEDLGYSLARMVEAATARGDAEESFALARRRRQDGLALVTAEPNNWKYVLNLAQAYIYTASGLQERGDLEKATHDANEAVRLTAQLCKMQPNRRSFIEWSLFANHRAKEIAKNRGDQEGATRFALVAFSEAVRLAYGDPRRADGLEYVLSAGSAAAYLTGSEGDDSNRRYVCDRLRDVVALARGAGAPAEAIRLLTEETTKWEAILSRASDK